MNREELLSIAKPILFNTDMVKAILEGRKTVTRRVLKKLPDCKFIKIETNPAVCFNGNLDKTKKLKGLYATFEAYGDYYEDFPMRKSTYNVGDILYVKEAWQYVYETEYEQEAENHCVNIRKWIPNFDDIPKICLGLSSNDSCASMEERNQYIIYKASDISFTSGNELRFSPSIHMPKEATRIFLKVTDVRVEKLQDIDGYGVEKEGLQFINNPLIYEDTETFNYYAHKKFADLWNSTINKSELYKYGWNANPYVWVYEFERIDVND
jgi:hypothetical protein